MHFLDLPSLALVGLTGLLAALSVRFSAASWQRMSATLLPVGVIGTSIGMVHLLRNLDDPTLFKPALFVAALCIVYSLILRVLVDLISRPAPHAPLAPSAGGFGVVAVLLFLLLIGAAVLSASPLPALVDLSSMLIIAFALLMIRLLPVSAERHDFLTATTRVIPIVGIASLLVNNGLIWFDIDDPSTLGPALARGLLAHLYANIYLVSVSLLRPNQLPRSSDGFQWTVELLSIVGMGSVVAPIWYVLSPT